MSDLLYPNNPHPYYIVTPPYMRTSAGVRVLHLLCHALNRQGQTAYLIIYPDIPWRRGKTLPDLLTPVLTPAILRDHTRRGLKPIMVYPEISPGTACGGGCVVRYVMNFPGLLGGDTKFVPDELVFSYSRVLAESTTEPDNILFVPATDTSIFRMPPPDTKRQGSCFYADKYKTAHRGQLFEITKNSIEITRDQPHSQSPQEIAKLFQTSEVFFTYENTALAIEAVLCGCPAVFLPNQHLSEIIAARELGPEGYAWGSEPAAIARARETVEAGAANYLRSYAEFWRELQRFIVLTQAHAAVRPAKPVRLPGLLASFGFLLRRRGVLGALRKIMRSLAR